MPEVNSIKMIEMCDRMLETYEPVPRDITACFYYICKILSFSLCSEPYNKFKSFHAVTKFRKLAWFKMHSNIMDNHRTSFWMDDKVFNEFLTICYSHRLIINADDFTALSYRPTTTDSIVRYTPGVSEVNFEIITSDYISNVISTSTSNYGYTYGFSPYDVRDNVAQESKPQEKPENAIIKYTDKKPQLEI